MGHCFSAKIEQTLIISQKPVTFHWILVIFVGSFNVIQFWLIYSRTKQTNYSSLSLSASLDTQNTLQDVIIVEWKKFRQEIPVWDSTVPSKQVLQKPLLDLSLLTFISIVLCRNCCLFSKAKCLLSCCRKKNVLLHITYWVFFPFLSLFPGEFSGL